MCKHAVDIIRKMLEQPVERLILTKKPLPNIEVLRLYREAYKFAAKMYWNNEKGEPWK